MPRVKRGVTAHARHKKVLKKAKGYYGARSRVYRVANQAVTKAGQYAYRDRRQRKRQFRRLWIARINAAARMLDISYSRLIDGMNKADIEVDRKVLADLAVHDIDTFGKIAEKAKGALVNWLLSGWWLAVRSKCRFLMGNLLMLARVSALIRIIRKGHAFPFLSG